MSASGYLISESDYCDVINERCVIYVRGHPSRREGCGWLQRFNKLSPHPEEHAGSARVRLEGWPHVSPMRKTSPMRWHVIYAGRTLLRRAEPRMREVGQDAATAGSAQAAMQAIKQQIDDRRGVEREHL